MLIERARVRGKKRRQEGERDRECIFEVFAEGQGSFFTVLSNFSFLIGLNSEPSPVSSGWANASRVRDRVSVWAIRKCGHLDRIRI
jgi:hypothetical protein